MNTSSNSVNNSVNKRTGLWLCLHFEQLPIEVFTRDKDNSTPVVVLARQRVAFINPAARRIGIRIDSSMNTAYTISEQVVSFERDEEREFSTLSQLAQWAYQFTPNVSVKAPHSLLLDVEGCLKLFHGLENLKRKILTGLAKLGFQATIGINGTPLSALCFAESLAESFAESHAESSTEDNTGDVAASLASIPIQFLRIDDAIKDRLHQMGIYATRQLLGLPLDGLNRRFGVFFTDYLQRLTGEKPDPQKFVGDKPRFMSEITFLADVTNIESLIFPIKRLLAELQDFLRGRQLLINQFSLRLSHRSHEPRSFNIYLTNPENDAAMFLMLSQLQLEKINDMPEVDHIRLGAKTFFEAESNSGDLFHGTRFKQKDGRIHSKAEQARAARLLNMLDARLGRQACFGLSLANDHRPEHAWKPVQLAHKDYWYPEQPEPNARPIFLLSAPKILRCEGNQPCMAGRLELLQGPERIDFGWWDNQNVARDYYISRHDCGALYWVFRHLDDNNWYLHGIFS